MARRHSGTEPPARNHAPATTPDERYLVVRGRLWRKSNPHLDPQVRQQWVQQLMQARRAVREALQQHDQAALQQAREQVQAAKVALGERGPVWWDDGAPDYNRYLVHNTPYAAWWTANPDAHQSAAVPCNG